MRLNSKILYMIISLAFVGGMFSAAYAGPILPTITLAGNVHTTGDSVVDGDLSVGGVSFAALDARIAALETSTVPMVIANEAMITTHDTTLTTHDTMILSNQADIATNTAAIAEGGGGGGPNPCNPNGDSMITAQEIVDVMLDNGFSDNILSVQNRINDVDTNANGVIDTSLEMLSLNAAYITPIIGIVCEFP